ncbi:UNVERIFIED_CONTAM: hypothetical protein FKN15_042354 [Acipenser sinensis]
MLQRDSLACLLSVTSCYGLVPPREAGGLSRCGVDTPACVAGVGLAPPDGTGDRGASPISVGSSKLASEPEIPAPSSSVRALMERATNFLQVPWKVSSGLKADFDPPAFSSFPGFSGGGQILLATPGLSAQRVQECSRTCLHAGCRGGRAVGGLSKDPVCPNGQCGITEAHLKKAYAAEAQVTCLANTGGLLTVYPDGMLCSVTLPEPLASELHAVSGTLLQISRGKLWAEAWRA